MPQIQLVGGRIANPRGPEHFKTYSVNRPLQTHWRWADCDEYECDDFLSGFITMVDTSTELGQRQANFIRHDKTRRWYEDQVGETLIHFRCGPGNRCVRFREHRVPTDRPPFLLVAQGDWRGNPRRTPVTRHRSYDSWCDDFASHQERIKKSVMGA